MNFFTISMLSIAVFFSGFTWAMKNDCIIDSKLLALGNDSQVITIGEIHGTKEIPDYFSKIICAYSKEYKSIKVGLELPVKENKSIQEYISSKGEQADISKLLSKNIWQHVFQDGRTSIAMFDLIENIRVMKKSDMPIELFLFDTQSKSNREQTMAEKIEDNISKQNGTPTLLLTGNIHSRTKLGAMWSKEFKSSSYQLLESGIKVSSVIVNHQGGNAWLCSDSCKSTGLSGYSVGNNKYKLTTLQSSSLGHDYELFIGEITTSIPAKQRSL